jgi:pyridoxine kinase
MARILAISSQTAYGPVGNAAAVPALEWLGHTVLAVPTVVLSYHPGHGPPAGLLVPARDLAAMLDSLEAVGALEDCAAVMTGYFAADEQIHAVERTIMRMKERSASLSYFCDPILGDDPGGLYVPLPVAEAVRDRLLPLADIAAPNRFELAWLTGREVAAVSSAIDAARALSCAETLATSIPDGPEQLATIAITKDAAHTHLGSRLAAVPHGTGDLLSGLYLGHRLNRVAREEALIAATTTLNCVIAASAGTPVLDLARGLRRATAS